MPRKRTSTSVASGHQEAQRLYPDPLGDCEMCGTEPAHDRHHIDGNTLDNRRVNVWFLCVRCHMAIDGRLEALREWGRRNGPTLVLRRWRDAPRVTHCKHGHSYAGDNLYVDPRGRRQCRACKREWERRHQR